MRPPAGRFLLATLYGKPVGCVGLTLHVKAGARAVQLNTNRALTETIGLCRSAGYAEIPAFNDESSAHRWFGKELA